MTARSDETIAVVGGTGELGGASRSPDFGADLPEQAYSVEGTGIRITGQLRMS